MPLNAPQVQGIPSAATRVRRSRHSHFYNTSADLGLIIKLSLVMTNAAFARHTLWQCCQLRAVQLQGHSRPTERSFWSLVRRSTASSPCRSFGTSKPTARNNTSITSETANVEATGTTCPTTIARPRLSPLPFIYLRNLPYERSSALQQLLVDRQLRLRKEREDLRTQAAAAAATGEVINGLTLGLAEDVTNIPKEDGGEDLILLVEHTPTYTNGRRNRGAQGISDQEVARLQSLGAVYVESLRGGEITFHGPGQLVAYPILDLKPIMLSVRCYVSYLEKSIIATCAEFGVKAITTENTGVWISDQKKIAAIGVHVQRYITSHGLALNCNTELEFFNQIVACGLTGKETTSLSKELGDPSVDVRAVIPKFLKGFGATFNRELVALSETRPELEKAIQDYIQTGNPEKLR
ncbi:lipoyltransferase [Linnemannia elongata AG-77]|uniref:lipoyl(octanoyl) transferase n=1 Tax=Linnemannia elongata AG-77 TaxID=1314771 RepID=A0A197KHT3_9FUNG|nr:lipoyltransferase [Linnemannia elongata AG-77]